ncbi:CRISPR-associated endonuclease Cas1 [Chitinilyticum piscinae]|uniref:CRISPR-associated endonuclease Cas1 n=1 Tax=Chitinilyticum piscinae TaxID=2866724 RepID=A0A8J7FUI1_9NEIS|nr:CRISPR-associated endonuclease Cas1 [Chitinilyticum piscinae]MBE9610836.1 CRISPR-associated endonuclease Cas1 [Chitinilyticum piscinae]
MVQFRRIFYPTRLFAPPLTAGNPQHCAAVTPAQRLLPDEPDTDNSESDFPEQGWRLFTEKDAQSPIQRSLYVHEQGISLLKEGERLLVTGKHDAVRASIPLHTLDQIVIYGNALVSTALLRYCHQRKLAVHFHSWHGEPAGSLDLPRGATELQANQFERLQNERWQHNFARAHVIAKIHNMLTLLQRYRRSKQLGELEQHARILLQMKDQAREARSLDQLRGCEGMATRAYFQLLRQQFPPEWGFAGRNRQPPRDVGNAVLSYGYGILYRMVWSFISRRGLSPWLGALHVPKAGFAALAADLMEEFRAPLVDSVILQLANSGVRPIELLEPGSETRLSVAGRKQIVAAIEARLRVPIQLPGAGRGDYQRLIAWQVRHYADVLLGRDVAYSGFHWR